VQTWHQNETGLNDTGICRSVSQIPPFPFATLALVQNAGGALYVGCNIFSRDYTLPSSAT